MSRVGFHGFLAALRALLARSVETRSIDYIPEAERHGGLLSQFTLWLAANLQITAVVTGSLAVVLGGDVAWSLVGLLIGQLLGGAVMALHGAQGPQLGLPQMISCRVQFGVYGAIVPIAAVCLMYVGFSASGVVLAGQAVGKLLHLGEDAGIALFSVVIVAVTLFGYQVIHTLGRISSAVGVAAFLYLFSAVFAHHDVAGVLSSHHFLPSQFLLAISLSASWQIAFGPYVADYSRYLPRSTSAAGTFLAVGGGSVLGAQLAMTLGVLAAALGGSQFEHHEVAYVVQLGSGGATAALLFFCIAFGKVTVTSLNAYGSFMSAATIVSGLRRGAWITVRDRVVYVVLMVAISMALALLGRHSFLRNLEAFILLLLAVFTPWSAINLVDYYFFTRSRYDVPALYQPAGRYGAWNVTGLVTYFIGILVQIPFMSSALYTGPLVARLGGADISWILGLMVPALLYYVAARVRHTPIPARLILPAEPEEASAGVRNAR